MSSDSTIMIPGTNMSLSRKKVIKTLVITAIITLFINCLIFTYYNANPLIKSDGWRFIKIYLMPWLNNELNWIDLWQDHHPQPLTAILFLANATLFDLRMDYEALFAVFFSLFSLLILWRLYNKNTDVQPQPWKYIFIILSAALLFSLTSTAIYTWSLVTLGYIFIFFSLLVLASLNNLYLNSFSYHRFILSTIYTTLFFLVFYDGAKIIIYPCLTILFLSFFIDRNTKWLRPIFSIISSLIIQYATLQLFSHDTKYSEAAVILTIVEKFKYLPEYFLYIGTGLLSAWVNIELLIKKTGATPFVIYFLGIFVSITYLYTFYLFFQKRLFYKSIIPGTLILTSFMTGIGAAIFRFNPDTQLALSANVPRYYLLYCLGAIGIIWCWSILVINMGNNKLKKTAGLSVISLILVSQVLSSLAAWKSTPYRAKAYTNAYNIMIRNAGKDTSIKPPMFMVGHNYPEPYLSGLQLLKQHDLNLFNDRCIMKKLSKINCPQ